MKIPLRYCMLVVAIIILGVSSVYSMGRYQMITNAKMENIVMTSKPAQVATYTVSEAMFSAYLGVNTYVMYDVLKTRNIFQRSVLGGIAPVAAKPERVVMQALSLPVIEEKKSVIEPVVKKEPRYTYQGTMMLNGKKAHIVEQTEPYKTHFLGDGIPSGGLQVIDVGRYGITIQDKDKKTYELPIKKE